MIDPDHPEHGGYLRHLERTLRQSYARFFSDLT
jgi:hypothetical protein